MALKYLLDTNICIYIINNNPENVRKRFALCRTGEIGISAITYAELMQGSHKDSFCTLAKFIEYVPIISFGANAAKIYAEFARNGTRQKNVMDRLIAAHAKELGIILVTNNEADFIEYGVKIENWSKAKINP
jgi:tRNA(fMet)-specific endonuclease VapC